MLLPLLVPLPPRLRFAPKISADGAESAQEERVDLGLLAGLLPRLLLEPEAALLLLLLRSNVLLAGDAAAEAVLWNSARLPPQPAVMVHVPS